jgi:hypothetical protein
MNSNTKHARNMLVAREILYLPAVQFAKNGKWHLYNTYTGNMACIRYRNKKAKDMIDNNIKHDIFNQETCETCIQTLWDCIIQKEMEKAL